MESDSLQDAIQRALLSLEGLSVGDAFGEKFFHRPVQTIRERALPQGSWRWTDDTHMSLSVVETLMWHGRIDQDRLAELFAQRYLQEPWRGYGPGAHRLLPRYAQGYRWQEEAPRVFEGGSYGNGGAMRAAPIGAYFAGEPERAAEDGARSAAVTHAHTEGKAGAMGVAVAAALLPASERPPGTRLLRQVAEHLPQTRTRDGIERAQAIDADQTRQAAEQLGTGSQITAFDTVPYCLWVVAHHALDYETALWQTVAGLGDRDTTCAIVGGIVGSVFEVPSAWLERREPLPQDFVIG